MIRQYFVEVNKKIARTPVTKEVIFQTLDLSELFMCCYKCGNEDETKFMNAMVEGNILCKQCGRATVVRTRKDSPNGKWW